MLLFSFTFFLPLFTTIAYVVAEVYLFTAVLVVFLRQMESISKKTCLSLHLSCFFVTFLSSMNTRTKKSINYC